MITLIVGFIFIAGTVIAALPAGIGLGWGQDILLVLRGGAPIFTAFIGIISIFIGVADIRDKQDAKKEEAAMKAFEEKE